MFKSFIPDYFTDSVYAFDFEGLYNDGIRGLIFDIDNTLVPDEAPADEAARKLIKKLSDMGFKCAVVSNNDLDRVKTFADYTGMQFVEMAHKPSKKGFIKAMELMNTAPARTVVFGDQLITDVKGGRSAGLVTYLVRPIDPVNERKHIKFKRKLEKIMLFLNRKY